MRSQSGHDVSHFSWSFVQWFHWFHSVGIPFSTWQCRIPSWSIQVDESSSSNINLYSKHCAIVNTGDAGSEYTIPDWVDLGFPAHNDTLVEAVMSFETVFLMSGSVPSKLPRNLWTMFCKCGENWVTSHSPFSWLTRPKWIIAFRS